MIEKTVKILVSIILLTILGIPVSGQESTTVSEAAEDSIECMKQISIYREYVKKEYYDDATPAWRYCFNNCVDDYKGIYIDGADIMEYYIEKAPTKKLKSKYVDTLMMVYDQRIKYYDQEGFVLGRKGKDLLKYRRSDVEDAYKYLSKSIELQQLKTEIPVITTFMQASVGVFKKDIITKEEMVENFMTAMDISERKLTNAKSEKTKKYLNITIKNVENLFKASGAADCQTLVAVYEPKFNEDPDDIDILKKITSLFTDIGCEEEPLYIKVSEKLYDKEPSAEAAYNLAKHFFNEKQWEKAKKYYLEAVEEVEDSMNKSEYLFELAYTESELGQYSSSRTHAFEAGKIRQELDEPWGDPYILVATLYASSGGMCATDPNENIKAIQRKAVYWVAVDMLNKAISIDPSVKEKASGLISSYRAHYPNKQDAFFVGYKEGDTFKLNCWINKTTRVRF